MRRPLRSAAFFFAVSLFLLPLAHAATGVQATGKPIKVAWSPSRVESFDVVGTTITVQLTPDGTAAGATLRTSASLNGLIGLPAGPIDLVAGTAIPIVLEVLMTPDEAGRTIGGTVHVILDGKNLAQPLAISLKQTEPEEEEKPAPIPAPTPGGGPPSGNSRGGVVSWTDGVDPLYALTLNLLQSGSAQLTLIPNRDLSNVHLWLTPSLRGCIGAAVSPANVNLPGELEIGANGQILLAAAGTPVLIDVTLLVAPDALGEGCGGTIHVRNVGKPPRTWPTPLNVRLGAQEEAGEEIAPSVAVGAASFSIAPIAPGQIATIFGSGLCPGQHNGPAVEHGAVGEQLGGTMVFFDGIPGRMLMCSSSQINVIVPQGLDPGVTEVDLLVVRSGFQSTPFPVALHARSPELFTLTGEGRGQIAAFNGDGTLNRSSNPAPQGSTVVAFGGGAGPTDPPLGDGEIAAAAYPLAATVGIWVGGAQANVVYAGTSPGQVGALTQLNFTLGPGTPSGQQPIKLVVDGVESTQKTTMAVQ